MPTDPAGADTRPTCVGDFHVWDLHPRPIPPDWVVVVGLPISCQCGHVTGLLSMPATRPLMSQPEQPAGAADALQTLITIAQEFVKDSLRDGGCHNCGGLPHTTTCRANLRNWLVFMHGNDVGPDDGVLIRGGPRAKVRTDLRLVVNRNTLHRPRQRWGVGPVLNRLLSLTKRAFCGLNYRHRGLSGATSLRRPTRGEIAPLAFLHHFVFLPFKKADRASQEPA